MNKKLFSGDIEHLIESYKLGLSSQILAKEFNVYPSTIIRALRKYNVEVRGYSSAAFQALKSYRMKKNRIPQNLCLDKNLSYILGVLAGDGYVDYNDLRETWQIGLDVIDKEFVDRFYTALFDFFKIKPTFRIRKRRNENWNIQYTAKLCSKEACEFVNSIGKFRTENWFIPLIIKKSTFEIKRSFLQGFFDSEGEIDKSIGRVGATSINLKGLNEIGDMLKELDIRFTILKKKDNRPNAHQKYVLRINDKFSIINFYKTIGFTINRKRTILEKFSNKWMAGNVIAFPKNNNAEDVMLETPSEVTEKRLKEAHIRVDLDKKEEKKKKK